MQTKQERKIFTITEYDREQEYLSKRHREGWKFTAVTGYGMYHFEKCEPEEVVYQLDYNIEGNINHEEYTRMFEDCGWEYITTYVGYAYFRKPVADMKDRILATARRSSQTAWSFRAPRRDLFPQREPFPCSRSSTRSSAN